MIAFHVLLKPQNTWKNDSDDEEKRTKQASCNM